MKKKVIASALGIMLLSATVLPVYAADPADENTMEVGYIEKSTYTLSIPQSIEALPSTDVYATIGVSDINVAPNEQVQIKVKDGITLPESGSILRNYVKLTREGDGESIKSFIFGYKKTSSGSEQSIAVTNDSIIATFEGNSTEAVSSSIGKLRLCSLKSSNRGIKIKAGKYTGTLTFEGGIIKKK